ncbi:hypothetical protein JCM3766R1_005296 [Sporobolomyces carnicolor]
MSTWGRLVRFEPRSDAGQGRPLIGEPLSSTQDVGLATYEGQEVRVNVYDGTSVLSPGRKTGETAVVAKLLSPLAEDEVGTIRCIGLNYKKHAEECNLPIPEIPVVFLKPATSLASPYPDSVVVPKFTLKEEPVPSADYESELGVVIGKDCKNVTEADAMEYVLGYTATNDISSRKTQFETSQWCRSKSYDKACPMGPCIVSAREIPDPSKLHLRGFKNDKLMQESPLTDLIFSIPKIVSFLSQGTTLKAGTLIITGTPHGIGAYSNPPEFFKDGDVFKVEISGGIGTLVNKIEYEK